MEAADQELELYDVVSRCLSERGFINQWKSELMFRAVQPLYEAGLLPRVPLKIDSEEDPERLIKFRLLVDLLDYLRLDNTKQMLLCETQDEEGLLLAKDAEILVKSDTTESQLEGLWKACGASYLKEINKESEDTPDKDEDEDQDLFQTAISRLESELEETTLSEPGNADN